MRRIIVHWTAGAYKASSLDLAHYHILIEEDGRLVRGTHSILDNVFTGDSRYAAHTLRLNTGSIGVSVCCMAGASEQPFVPGSFPMKELQWNVMAQVVAELCHEYEISVTPQTVLGHGEVQANLQVSQHGKWDPMVLPWEPSLRPKQVGTKFRDLVKQHLASTVEAGAASMESPASITVHINGKIFREAQIFNEKSLIKLRPLVDEFDWSILHANDSVVELSGFGLADASPISIPYKLIDHSNLIPSIPPSASEGDIVELLGKYGFLAVTDVASMLGLNATWDGTARSVTIGP